MSRLNTPEGTAVGLGDIGELDQAGVSETLDHGNPTQTARGRDRFFQRMVHRIRRGAIATAIAIALITTATTSSYLITPEVTQAQQQAKPAALVLVDGLASRNDSEYINFERTFGAFRKGVFPNYQIVVDFSYRGGVVNKNRSNLPPAWYSIPYEPKDTFQEIPASAAILKETIDLLMTKGSYQPVDLLGYSEGAVVVWEYLMTNVLPEDGPHSKGVIRSVALLDGPINGAPEETLTTWGQTAGIIDTITEVGNPATQYITARARDPEVQEQTIAFNASVAQFLMARRGIRLLTATNGDNCLFPKESATIDLEGVRSILYLGRGPNGVLSCDLRLLALLSPKGLATNLGHTQILTAAPAVKQIEEFYRG